MADQIDSLSTKRANRPKYRNIGIADITLGYRLPLPGIISILHRISGAAMFLFGIPLALYLFQLSLTSELSWDRLTELTKTWWARAIALGFIWAFCHHFFCGLRYLMLDMHKGLEKAQARQSAMAVVIASLLATGFFAYHLFK